MKSSDFLHLTYGNPGEHTEVDSHKPFPQTWRLKPTNTPVSPPGTTRTRQYPRRGPFPTNTNANRTYSIALGSTYLRTTIRVFCAREALAYAVMYGWREPTTFIVQPSATNFSKIMQCAHRTFVFTRSMLCLQIVCSYGRARHSGRRAESCLESSLVMLRAVLLSRAMCRCCDHMRLIWRRCPLFSRSLTGCGHTQCQ